MKKLMASSLVLSLSVGLFSLFPTNAFAIATNDETAIVQIESCPSRSLRVELNAEGKASKNDVLSVLRIFASYPSLRFTPVRAAKPMAAFIVDLGQACETSECVMLAGWTELQWRLRPIKGVSVTCSSAENAEAMPESKAAKEGGVVGSN